MKDDWVNELPCAGLLSQWETRLAIAEMNICSQRKCASTYTMSGH